MEYNGYCWNLAKCERISVGELYESCFLNQELPCFLFWSNADKAGWQGDEWQPLCTIEAWSFLGHQYHLAVLPWERTPISLSPSQDIHKSVWSINLNIKCLFLTQCDNMQSCWRKTLKHIQGSLRHLKWLIVFWITLNQNKGFIYIRVSHSLQEHLCGHTA